MAVLIDRADRLLETDFGRDCLDLLDDLDRAESRVDNKGLSEDLIGLIAEARSGAGPRVMESVTSCLCFSYSRMASSASAR